MSLVMFVHMYNMYIDVFMSILINAPSLAYARSICIHTYIRFKALKEEEKYLQILKIKRDTDVCCKQSDSVVRTHKVTHCCFDSNTLDFHNELFV